MLKDVAEDPEVSVSSAFLSRVERNDALPSDELLLKLSRKLGFDASVALLHLFRERASPEAREFLPLPSALRPAPGAAGERYEGLEALAEPISQIYEVHRGIIAENTRLRAQNSELASDVHELSGEIAENNRDFLPDVNRFLMSLFNYESDVVRRDTVVSRNGDATITVTLEGIRPKKNGKPIRNLVHSVVLPQPLDGSLNISGGATHFEILEQPDDLEIEWQFKRQSSERGAFHVNFPAGFRWSPKAPRLSYRYSYRLEKCFVMTLEEAKATYGRRSVHDAPLEWSACFINKPVRQLEISVTYPEGYSPSYIDKWVFWTETSFLECDYNLADKLLVDRDEGIEMEQGDRTTIRLRAKNPLLGFSYGIVWQPLSKRQFFALINT
jgi:hypothetical protein